MCRIAKVQGLLYLLWLSSAYGEFVAVHPEFYGRWFKQGMLVFFIRRGGRFPRLAEYMGSSLGLSRTLPGLGARGVDVRTLTLPHYVFGALLQTFGSPRSRGNLDSWSARSDAIGLRRIP